jgi:hypothetical protein
MAKMATARAVIFSQATETGNRLDLGVLKFGTWSLASQVSRNLRRNRSDESGHRKSPKGIADIDRVMCGNGNFGFPNVTPEGYDPTLPTIETRTLLAE